MLKPGPPASGLSFPRKTDFVLQSYLSTSNQLTSYSAGTSGICGHSIDATSKRPVVRVYCLVKNLTVFTIRNLSCCISDCSDEVCYFNLGALLNGR